MIDTVSRLIDGSGFAAAERRLAASRTYIFYILALALIVRAVTAFLFANIDPASANIWEYGNIARWSLAEGKMVSHAFATVAAPGYPAGVEFTYPTAFMPPISIYMWMAVFFLFGVTKTALAIMILLNVVLGVAIVYYAMRVADTLFESKLLSVGVGLILALHPVFVFSVATYHVLNLYILLLLIIFDLTISTRRQTYWISISVGLLTGVATLVRTEYLVLAGAINLAALINHRDWKKTLVAAVAALIVIAHWTVRNYSVFQQFIPVANSEGYNLFKGFNPEANGSGNWVDEHRVAQRLLGNELKKVPPSAGYETAVDKIYRAAAINFIKEHPFRSFLVLPVYKVTLFWSYDFTDPVTHKFLYQLQFWPLFLLSVFGLYAAAQAGFFSRPDHRTVLILFIFQTLVMMGYAVHARYRMNVEPFLYAYAVWGALGLSSWGRGNWRSITGQKTSAT